MFTRTHAAVLVAMTAGLAYASSTHADMYVWTDKAGVKNISNVPPPEGTPLMSVTRAPPSDPARDVAVREAARAAEMRALNERVHQLEAEVEQARREPPPTIVMPQPQYAPAPSPPTIIVVSPPPAPAYPQPVAGCDLSWAGCGFWPGFYPSGVVVVRDRHFRRHHPIHHGQPRPFGQVNIPPIIRPLEPPVKPLQWRK